VLNGFYNYYAVPTKLRALNAFYYHVLSHRLRCLRRRSQRDKLTWRKMMRIAERLAAQPEIRHPYPAGVRRHDPRQEPGAVVPLAGICAGGGEQSPSVPRRVILQ
jgi:hypothetical protein